MDSSDPDPVHAVYRTRRLFVLPTLLAALVACENSIPSSTDVDDPVPPSARNILLIIADDLGKDALASYGEGSIKPNTPNLDALAASGLVFTDLWVTPSCAPTRATIITGKYGFRTGVQRSAQVLSDDEDILQAYIARETGNAYATAVLGKWHLARGTTFDPETLGIDYYAGVLNADPGDYYAWDLRQDGGSTFQSGYNTEVITDLAIDWIAEQERSWFLWLAYNAPHAPFHVPPAEMHGQGALPAFTNGVDPTPYYLAAIEAMDHQIGRLLDSLTPAERAETTILFVGDNGSPGRVAQAPYDGGRAKGTLYQGGINTPLIVAGRGVSRVGRDDTVINGTDLFATIAALAGVGVDEIHDSRSFMPLLSAPGDHRDFALSEIQDADEGGLFRTVRDARYKLHLGPAGETELYDLASDPYEADDLLQGAVSSEAADARAAMEAWLTSIGG